jgi:hypothetical protein
LIERIDHDFLVVSDILDQKVTGKTDTPKGQADPLRNLYVEN